MVVYSLAYSVFLSTRPTHLSLAYLIFSFVFATHAFALISSFLIFSTLFIPSIHLKILISVLSSRICSAFLSVQVSLSYIRTGKMNDGLIYCWFEHNGHLIIIMSKCIMFIVERLQHDIDVPPRICILPTVNAE